MMNFHAVNFPHFFFAHVHNLNLGLLQVQFGSLWSMNNDLFMSVICWRRREKKNFWHVCGGKYCIWCPVQSLSTVLVVSVHGSFNAGLHCIMGKNWDQTLMFEGHRKNHLGGIVQLNIRLLLGRNLQMISIHSAAHFFCFQDSFVLFVYINKKRM